MIGIAAHQLDDATLDRELRRMHQTRSDTFFDGCASALTTHTERMLELEAEFLRRHPELAAPNPLRLRETTRQASALL